MVNSKQKGKRGEQEVVNTLKSWGMNAKRTAPMQAGFPEDYPDVLINDKMLCEVKTVKSFSSSQIVANLSKKDVDLMRIKVTNKGKFWAVPDDLMEKLLKAYFRE